MKKTCNTDIEKIDRRSVLKIGVVASAAGIAGVSLPLEASRPKGKKRTTFFEPGNVVRVSMPGMRKSASPDKKAVKEMVEEAVKAIAGKKDSLSAWSRFVNKNDKVAVKVNGLGGLQAATQREVTNAVVEGVRSVGVPKKNIIIFDQFESAMKEAGYHIVNKKDEVRVYSEKNLGYEAPLVVGVFSVKLAKVLSWATAVINVPVLKEHPMCGISGAIKNMVFGCVESPDFLHDNINEALTEIYYAKQINSKVRLHIMDGSHVQYDGGPMYVASARAQHDCIYAATDPVAMDVIEWEVVEEYRAKNKLKTLKDAGRPPRYLKLAQKRGLGIADRKKITLKEIELPPLS